MSPFSSEEFARPLIRVQKIIVAALVMGQMIFAVIVISVRFQQPPAASTLLSYMSLGMAVVMLAVRAVVGSTTAAAQRRQIANGTWTMGPQRGSLPVELTDGDRLLFALQAKTIVQAALLEGSSFFALIAFLVEGQAWTLLVPGILLTILLGSFPTYERAENWVKQQLELIELEKGRQ